MSVTLMSGVFALPADATATVAQRFILVALADNANDEGLCWPLEATIAQKCGMSEVHCRRSLAALRKDGWLTRERTKRDDGKFAGNRYWLNVGRITIDRRVSVQTDRPVSVVHRSPSIGQEPSVNLEPSIEPSASQTTTAVRRQEAREIIEAWWGWYETQNGHAPMGNYHAAVNSVVSALRVGHSKAKIKAALMTLTEGTVSTFGLARALNNCGSHPRPDRASTQLEAIRNA